MSKRKDVLAISSGGGHWVQLMRLKEAWAGRDVVYATVNKDSKVDVPGMDFYVIPDANRWTKIALIRSFLVVFILIIKIRPRIIITTGAAPGFFAIFFGRFFGSKTMWIDSIANASELSMSGRFALKIANECLTQWEGLASPNGPKYFGAVI